MTGQVHYTYKMVIAYDGTSFMGWQVQKSGPTIQQLIQEALSVLLRTLTHVTGAGRTDAGVHALGQCAHFHTVQQIDSERIRHGLNGLLPPQIRICSIAPADATFHARYGAVGKFYRYHLTLTPYANPMTRLYSWHIPVAYDAAAAESALAYFRGSHDFTSFANVGSCRRSDAVRTISRLESLPTVDGLCYEFEGSGFLYKMVRNIVGVLVAVGTGRLDASNIPALFAMRDRRAALEAAPPHGLCLVGVDYTHSG